MDVESFIQDTVLDNVISFAWSHGAGTKRVPCSLNVTLDPFDDVLDVFLAVRQIFADRSLIGVEPGDVGWVTWLEGLRPGTCEKA